MTSQCTQDAARRSPDGAGDLYRQAISAAAAILGGDRDASASIGDPRALAHSATRLCPAVGLLIAWSKQAEALRQVLGPLEVAHLAGDVDEHDRCGA
jgi:hypothetical protein